MIDWFILDGDLFAKYSLFLDCLKVILDNKVMKITVYIFFVIVIVGCSSNPRVDLFREGRIEKLDTLDQDWYSSKFRLVILNSFEEEGSNSIYTISAFFPNDSGEYFYVALIEEEFDEHLFDIPFSERKIDSTLKMEIEFHHEMRYVSPPKARILHDYQLVKKFDSFNLDNFEICGDCISYFDNNSREHLICVDKKDSTYRFIVKRKDCMLLNYRFNK